MSNTGKYQYDSKTDSIIKISDKVTIHEHINYINADEDIKASYESLERQGKLKQVDDDWKSYADR